MVRLKLSLELNYEIQGQGSDFIFNIHNAHTRHQRVSDEHLELSQSIATDIYTDPATQIVKLSLPLRIETSGQRLSLIHI